MTSLLFSEWLLRLNAKMSADGRHILLLLDNASCHKIEEHILTNIRVMLLPPNTTSVLQPLDAGIIASFKQRYKKYQNRHTLDAMEAPQPPKKPYEVNQLKAMEWCRLAWNEVSANTIRNCWEHTGIVANKSLAAKFDAMHISPMSVGVLCHAIV